MSELQQLIQETEKEIEILTAVLAKLKAKAGTADPGQMHSENGEAADAMAKVKTNEFFAKSQPDAARALLERVGRPLRTQEIIDAIEKAGVNVGGKNPKAKKQNFYTILSRGSEFGLFRKDTWGLKSWPGIKKTKENAAKTEKENDSEDLGS